MDKHLELSQPYLQKEDKQKRYINNSIRLSDFISKNNKKIEKYKKKWFYRFLQSINHIVIIEFDNLTLCNGKIMDVYVNPSRYDYDIKDEYGNPYNVFVNIETHKTTYSYNYKKNNYDISSFFILK
jgi:hypothetical protein